tara:strand:+ start:206 stop:1000 length:795 start_codon:yes stop_codon:yes gene_type:complete
MEKFKANPYNPSNKLISKEDIINIMQMLNINDFNINNLSLYQTAFIHKSYCPMVDYEEFSNDNNDLPLQEISYETMEFLGDSLLSSSTSSYLYDRFYKIHEQNEGFLTKIRTRIVCGENLAKLSHKLGFNEFLVISKHIEENCSGRNNQHILEDVFEAFLGAIFLDNDSKIDFIKEIIIKIIEEFVDFTDIIINDTNYKDQILKYCQHNFKTQPSYNHIRKDDNNIFSCELKINDITINGYGATKKKAEQDASKNTLKFFNVIT